VKHKALEKVAAHEEIQFSPPEILALDVEKKHAIILVTGWRPNQKEKREWSIGEAAPYNNKNSYPFAMAEKRAKDRVILKLVGLHGEVYSEEEADEFKESRPLLVQTMQPEKLPIHSEVIEESQLEEIKQNWKVLEKNLHDIEAAMDWLGLSKKSSWEDLSKFQAERILKSLRKQIEAKREARYPTR
tara:strand:+ start:1153 stop:1713 length:561 start_codon:yes stop_codon:yes gene_type:complete